MINHRRAIRVGRPRNAIVAVFIVFLVIEQSAGDEVIMSNGDRLTGRIARTDQGSLRLETGYAGTLTIDWSKVQNVRFDEPRKVLLDDESTGRVNEFSRNADQVTVKKHASSKSISVAPSRVRVIEPEPWETDEGAKLSGRVNLALKSQEGNTDKNEIDFDYMLDCRRRWHRLQSARVHEYDSDPAVAAKDTDTTLRLKLGYEW